MRCQPGFGRAAGGLPRHPPSGAVQTCPRGDSGCGGLQLRRVEGLARGHHAGDGHQLELEPDEVEAAQTQQERWERDAQEGEPGQEEDRVVLRDRVVDQRPAVVGLQLELTFDDDGGVAG